MNEPRQDYFEKIESPSQENFLRQHTNCILCGEALDLRHIKDQGEHTIVEEAFCWNCEVRAREKVYTVN